MRGKLNSFKFFLPAQEALMLIHDLPLFLLLFLCSSSFWYKFDGSSGSVCRTNNRIQHNKTETNQACSIKSLFKTIPNKGRLNLV